ncbi:MAG: hypothetical protein LBR53_10495 [Deltaproteobacteria bacterium]|jgi:hypothetical protein|nr:hypothetical protein [Deltaproteobacteria bacterium]
MTQSHDKKSRDNYMDMAWKWIVIFMMEAFFEFFRPDVAELIANSPRVTYAMDKSLPLLGADSSRGERRPDVVITIAPLDNGKSYVTYFVELQQEKDPHLDERTEEYYVRLRSRYPGDTIRGFVICTGHDNEGDYLFCAKDNKEIVTTFKIWAVNVSRFELEDLAADDRPFACVLYIARLAYGAGRDTASRKKIAEKVVKFLKGKKLSKNNMSACLTFAYQLLRLQTMDVNDKLRKEYEMLITDRKRMVVEQIREEGLLQGWEEGQEKGRKEGLEEGDLKARQAIAMKMLAMELPLDAIVKACGLPEREVFALQDGLARQKS